MTDTEKQERDFQVDIFIITEESHSLLITFLGKKQGVFISHEDVSIIMDDYICNSKLPESSKGLT